jgi:hypothetical protein
VLEPETLRQLQPDITETAFNRVMATKVLIKTRGYWEDMFEFENIVLALNGRIPDPKHVQGCTSEELWYALEMAHNLFPEREFADEIIEYAKYFFNQDGVYIYPPFFPIPNPYYSKAVLLAEQGPFPLGETIEEIQAAKYLAIQEYIKGK